MRKMIRDLCVYNNKILLVTQILIKNKLIENNNKVFGWTYKSIFCTYKSETIYTYIYVKKYKSISNLEVKI